MLELRYQNGKLVQDARSVKFIFDLKQRTARFTDKMGRTILLGNGKPYCYMASMGRAHVHNLARLVGAMFGMEPHVIEQSPESVSFEFEPDPNVRRQEESKGADNQTDMPHVDDTSLSSEFTRAFDSLVG